MEFAPLTFAEIEEASKRFGWDDVGITKAVIPDADRTAYETWIDKGLHAGMQYMENGIRCDPQQLFPGAKTALIFVTYYKQEKLPFLDHSGLIASYARGKDYHRLHKKRLKGFINWLEERTGQKEVAKGFSDSTPILEKALAVQAGLGWFGKNTLLIHRRFGTFTLLSGLLTTLEIEIPKEIPELRLPKCGSCTRCLDACPTQALSPYELNANRCLSYHLIESKGAIPAEIREKNPGYAFGCDICQDACPHNARKPLSEVEELKPDKGIGPYLSLEEMENTIIPHPEKLFGTPLQRRGAQGLMDNIT